MQALITWLNLSDIPAKARKPYIQAFSDINCAWINEYFVLEDKDKKTLGDPETYVLKLGGEVLFGCINNEVAVTCCVLKINNDLYELSKMGVVDLPLIMISSDSEPRMSQIAHTMRWRESDSRFNG